MSDPRKETNPPRNRTEEPGSERAQGSEGTRQDWLARLREDEGWNAPAFPDNAGERRRRGGTAAAAQEITATDPINDEDDVTGDEGGHEGLKRAALLVLAGLALGWIGLVIASGMRPDLAARSAELINLIAVLTSPLVLLGGIAFLMLRRPSNLGAVDASRAGELADHAEQAATRLSAAHGQLMSHTQEFASVADQSANAILNAIQAMTDQTGQLERKADSSIATLTQLSEQIAAMTDSLPRLEDRLATLGETVTRISGELGQKHNAMDEQLQATALIAEEARLQLSDAGKLLGERLMGLRDGARQTGEELTNLSELSSARLDLTLDRVKSALDSTEQRIETQNMALLALVEQSRAGVESTSNQSLERFTEHCRKVEMILDALDLRIDGQADKSHAWLEGTAQGVNALANEFNALEREAMTRNERMSATMMQLSADTKRLVDAIDGGHAGAEQMIQRAEALLVALDSGVRELDESMPAAIGRVEKQIGTLHERIVAANPAIEGIEAVAAGVVSRIQESDQIARAHVAALGDAMQRSQGALVAQKEQIDALAAALAEASRDMTRLAESAGPQMVEALVRVRETAEAAAAKARNAMASVIPEAAAEIEATSGAAIKQAVTSAVSDELARLSTVADDAVKAAHRATDKLTRQMLTLTDASQELERTLSNSAERIEGQDRELMAHRSAQLIAALNERAIDVTKWLDKDVSEADWNAYLKGDHGLFARRATRLVTSGEARLVHALYNDDADFREHVNRYVHDFESLLRTVMATREGSTLALAMVSSDIGKLYVGLAQAIERLRTS
jgi:rRNA-processing protein FCF1